MDQSSAQQQVEAARLSTVAKLLSMGLAVAFPAYLLISNSNTETVTLPATPEPYNTTISVCPSEGNNTTTEQTTPPAYPLAIRSLFTVETPFLRFLNQLAKASMRPAISYWAQNAIQTAWPSSLSLIHSTDTRTLFLYIFYTGNGSLQPRLEIHGLVFFHGTPSLAPPAVESPSNQLATFDGHSHLLHSLFPTRLALPSPVSLSCARTISDHFLLINNFKKKSPKSYALNTTGRLLHVSLIYI